MRVVWNELAPNDRYVARSIRPVSHAEMGYVAHLYLPLVGVASHSLYHLLVHEVEERSGAAAEGTHRGLMMMLSLPLDRLLSARERLEAMGLLDVRRRENRDRDYFYEYWVKPPLSPRQFFQDEIWPVMLLNQVGKARYEQIRLRYADHLGADLDREYPYEENLTKRFYEVYHSLSVSELDVREGSETERFLTDMQEKYPTAPLRTDFEAERNPALDLSFVRLHLPSHVSPEDVLTTDNITFLYKLIHFYQLSTWLLGQELRDWSLYDSLGRLDQEALRRRFREKYADGRLPRPLPADDADDAAGGVPIRQGEVPAPGSVEFVRACRRFSPLALLERIVGGRVSKVYLERAEALVFGDGLPADVANALLLYALRETQMELPKAYIEAIRDSWKAKQITTVDAAVQTILERAEAKSQAEEKQRAKRDSSVARRGGRQVLQDKLPASVQRQLEREKAEPTDQGQPKRTVLDDPELKALWEALRPSPKESGDGHGTD